MARKLKLRHNYVAEINRCVGDNIARAARRLERLGYDVERLSHLTSLKIRPPRGNDFATLKSDLASILQPQRGSMIISSTSGRSWICSMRGNRPGDFIRVL